MWSQLKMCNPNKVRGKSIFTLNHTAVDQNQEVKALSITWIRWKSSRKHVKEVPSNNWQRMNKTEPLLDNYAIFFFESTLMYYIPCFLGCIFSTCCRTLSCETNCRILSVFASSNMYRLITEDKRNKMHLHHFVAGFNAIIKFKHTVPTLIISLTYSAYKRNRLYC